MWTAAVWRVSRVPGIVVFIVALAATTIAQSGGTSQISPSAVTGGGNTTSNGAESLTGSIGQSLLGISSGKTFSISGGLFGGRSVPFKFGDINGDQIVNISDLFVMANFLAGNIAANSSSFNKAAADLNGDGVVNIQDLFLLANYLAGNIHSLPV
jgi:hypothetical protein